ncbi:redoxin domain-containing protein [archaeon]|jgi:NADH-dependent peroxiredoxin subunit C|nr:redoxin domain-containing protein [archaeon]MBT4023191.1 redoxin domain-containing protein [archaeon]MBT4272397.1 redoxin domain-containing protein [archaeon]MBT4460694.1 redoxin domain-containing protein [archaeon]MBT4859126.1 redoxin domain-containing protein [archaeon]
MVKIGEKIEDMRFEVFVNNDFKKVNFSDYKGKWLVLFFYPADFTFVCPTELEQAAEMYDKFKEAGAEIISVSTDTVFSHLAWHDSSKAIGKIKFPMAADPTGKMCQYFGTYIEDEGLSLRGTFIINPDGILKAMDVHDNSIGRCSSEILRKLQAAIYVEGHDGEVCPGSWKPGDKTLKPGVDLVGKI